MGTKATNPPHGNNCTLSIPEYGSIGLRAVRVVHGMSVVAYAGESHSRRGKAYYTTKRTSGSFDLTIVFNTQKAHDAMSAWLERYARFASSADTPVNPVRVVIPSRKFDKVGALKGGMTYGDDPTRIARYMTLSFVGSSEPINRDSPLISRFDLGGRTNMDGDYSLPYFYPAGSQLSGTKKGLDTIYDQAGGDDRRIEEILIKQARGMGT